MNRKPDPDAIEGWLTELWSAADASTRAPGGFDERLFARIAADDAVARAATAAVRPAVFLPRALDGLPWWVRATGQRATVLALFILGVVVAAPSVLLETPSTAQALGAAATVWLNTLAASFAAPVTARLAHAHTGMYLAIGLLPAILLLSLELARRAQSWAYGLRAIRLGARS